MPTALSNITGQSFNDLYPQRPVWAIASNGTSANNSPVMAVFNEFNPYNPINVEFSGNAKTRARNFQDEMANSSYMFYGSTSQASSNSWSASSGYFGIHVSTQTGCLNNFDAFDNGNYGYYQAQSAQADALAVRSGTIVGESNWRQCFDLVLTNSGYLYKEEIGGALPWVTGGNKPFINMNTDIGGQFASAGAGNWGLGQIAHNRNSKRLLVVQPNGGSSGTSLTFRLHFFDLQNKIGRDTKIAQLKAWMVAAAAVGSWRYRYVDVVFSSPNCYFSANTSYDSNDSQVVLCDNDEVWMFKSADCANTGSSYSNVLFRVNLSGGTWLTGTYAATSAVAFSGTTQYGNQNGAMYGARHMNADDNSVIALYQHYYYYCCGFNLAMVSTASASATNFNYAVNQSTSDGFTIAPMGGPNFVMCDSSYNNDSYGPRIGFLNNETLAGTNATPSFQGYMYPSYNSSTAYGANLVLKVQPTTEWK